MAKFSIGITYTVWTDVEAKTEDEAVEKAVNTDYDVPDHFELNEYDDPKIHQYGKDQNDDRFGNHRRYITSQSFIIHHNVE